MLGLLGLRVFEACGADIGEGTRTPSAACGRQGRQSRTSAATAGGRADRPSRRRPQSRFDPAQSTRRPHGPALRTRRLRWLAEASVVWLPRMHPHMLRHTFVTTMLDAGVDLRDVQIAARHADRRTTMHYDRARKNLDRHPNYILAAYMASATRHPKHCCADERTRGSRCNVRWPGQPALTKQICPARSSPINLPTPPRSRRCQ